MANRYWVGGAGSWTTSSTTNWSASSGGASGASVPTASDSVFFDQVGTYTVTVTGALACLDFTVSLGVVTFTVSGSSTIAISGSLALSSGTVGTWSSSFSPTFNSTTSQTITTNGESIGGVTFNGVGGTWTLGSALTTGQNITLTNGTFDTSASNYAVTCFAFSSSNSNIRTLNVNASTFTITSGGWTCTTSTNLTVSGSGATVKMAASVIAKTFAGGSLNWGAITLDQGGSTLLTISGSNTFANISNSYNATGATSIRFTSGTTQTVSSFTATGTLGNVLTIDSTTPGTAATLSQASGTVSVNYVSIQDSTATGGATWNVDANSTDVSGNTGWIFASPTRYWVGGAGNWTTSDTTHWSASSGGAGGATVPTAPVDVFFDQAGTYTVTVTGPLTCRDFTVSAGLVTFTTSSGSQAITISGSLALSSGTVGTWSSSFIPTFNATTSKSVSTNNEPIGAPTFNGVGGTWTLGSAFSVNSGTLTLTNGTFDTSASNYAVTCPSFSSSNSNIRTLNLNASTFTITGSSWTCTTATNLTVSGSGATVTTTSASSKTFAGGGANYGAFTLNQGGAGQLTISGSNTFANISNSYNATGATTIRFTSGTTQTVTSFTAEGTSGKILTINSTTPGTAATLSKASGTVSVDFVSIQDSTATGGATWNAGLNSTDVSGNTGWVFPPIRYWVGGSGTWDTSSTTNWSTSSGGASGASVPTAANNVVLDQVGTYTVTVTGALACLDFTVSAGIVTFALGTTPTLTISGNMSLASGTVGSWDQNFNSIFNATTSKTITTNGESIGNVTFNGVGGIWTLGSALTTPQDITLTNGTFSTSASNYAVSSANFNSNNANTRTLNVNASTFTVTSSWTCTTATGLTVSGSGATVTMTGASAKTFAGGSFNWGAITLDQGGAGALTISGSNTFANISNSYNATAATIIRFTSGTTQTITSFTAEGTAGKVLIIDSTTPATAATLSKTSGTVSVNYVSIQDSTATGGAVWEAGFNSTDVSGNTGWIFLVPPPVPPNTDVTNVRLRSFTERGRD